MARFKGHIEKERDIKQEKKPKEEEETKPKKEKSDIRNKFKENIIELLEEIIRQIVEGKEQHNEIEIEVRDKYKRIFVGRKLSIILEN